MYLIGMTNGHMERKNVLLVVQITKIKRSQLQCKFKRKEGPQWANNTAQNVNLNLVYVQHARVKDLSTKGVYWEEARRGVRIAMELANYVRVTGRIMDKEST